MKYIHPDLDLELRPETYKTILKDEYGNGNNTETSKLRRKISTAIKDGLVCSKPISFLSNGRDNIYYIMEKEYFIVYTKTDCYYCKNIESEELFISLIDCYKLNCKDWIKMDNIKIKMEEVIVCF